MFAYLLTAVLVVPTVGTGAPPGLPRGGEQMEKRVAVKTAPQRQGFLGVQITDLTKETAKELKAKASEGALVTAVTKNSPAEKAGIAKDDIIIEFNGRTIYDSDDLTKAVRRASPGTAVTVVVERKGDRKTLQATPGKFKHSAFSVTIPKIQALRHLFAPHREYGLGLRDLTPQLRKYFGAPEGRGILVDEVEEESVAGKAGFEAGDIILRIGSEPIEDLEDVRDGLEDYHDGEKAEVEILRRGSRKTLELPFEEEAVGQEIEILNPEYDQLRINLDRENHILQEALQNYRTSVKKRTATLTR